MRKTLSKNLQIFIVLLTAVFTFYACNKQEINTEEELKAISAAGNANNAAGSSLLAITNPFTRTVGAPIDGELGRRWIENFKKVNRSSTASYVIGVRYLQSILNNSQCVGICLYYAVDENRQIHVLPVGMDENGKIIKSANIITKAGFISLATAQKWIYNYTGLVPGHFFGSLAFGRFFSDPSCNEIRMSFAFDDNGKPQLLLSDKDDLNPEVYMDRNFLIENCILCTNP